MKHLIYTLLLACCALPLSAQYDVTYAYASPDEAGGRLGSGKTYSGYTTQGIYVSPRAAGMQITSITVPLLTTATGASDLTYWISDDLRYETVNGVNVNVPDVVLTVDYPTAGASTQFVTVPLLTPHTVPEGGCWVGYSFHVDQGTLNGFPLVTCETALGLTGGCWCLETDWPEDAWHDYSADYNWYLLVSVNLQGTLPQAEAVLGKPSANYVAAGAETPVTVPIYNYGVPVTSLTYETSAPNCETLERTLTFDEPLPTNFLRPTDVELSTPVLQNEGAQNVTLALTAVNGEPYTSNQATGTVNALPYLPKHNAVIEEWTGTWCEWCIRGYVALEELERLYPSAVVVAYHGNNKDPMASIWGYPKLTGSFPAAYLDRQDYCDPYFGPSGVNFGIKNDWLKANQKVQFASIDASATLDGTSVNVQTQVDWAIVPDDANSANYRIEYILTGDNLYDDAWGQNNGYYQRNDDLPLLEEYMAGGSKGTYTVYGLTFNNVALLNSGGAGIDGSIQEISADVPSTHNYTFDLTAIRNTLMQTIPYHEDALHVVALLLKGNDYGTVIDAVKVPVQPIDGLGTVLAPADSDDPSASGNRADAYDLQGRRIYPPLHGIYINHGQKKIAR